MILSGDGAGERDDDGRHNGDKTGIFAAVQGGDDGHAKDDEVHTDLALDDRAAALGVGLQPAENEQCQRQYDEDNDDGGQKRLAVDRDIPLRAVQAVKELGGQQQLKAQAVHDIQRFFIHPAQPPYQHADAQHQQDGGHDPDGEQKSLHFLSFPLRPSTSRGVFFHCTIRIWGEPCRILPKYSRFSPAWQAH